MVMVMMRGEMIDDVNCLDIVHVNMLT